MEDGKRALVLDRWEWAKAQTPTVEVQTALLHALCAVDNSDPIIFRFREEAKLSFEMKALADELKKAPTPALSVADDAEFEAAVAPTERPDTPGPEQTAPPAPAPTAAVEVAAAAAPSPVPEETPSGYEVPPAQGHDRPGNVEEKEAEQEV